LAAARISAASARLIQSLAAPATRQSPPSAVAELAVAEPLPVVELLAVAESLPVDEPLAVDVDASPPPPPGELPTAAASSPDFDVRDLPGDEVAERSFFAQPEPLKWTAGAEKPRRIVPSAPQLGQNRGPPSWIPWMTSIRCPQRAQV
jgi:hypothetical protein